MPITLDACIAQHRGDRREQQDRVALLPHPKGGGIVLAVVADGMGGHTGGVLAAEQVIHTARSNLETFSASNEEAAELLEASLLEAHLLIKASRFMNEKDPHSTAAMLLLEPGRASWAHCGDTRVYRFRGDRVVFRSADHSYVGKLQRQGAISAEQALLHPHRNILLTSLGGVEAPTIDFGEACELAAGDAFLLCSDGLWTYFSDAELAATIAGASARQASETLIAGARERGHGEGDNVSLAILKLVDAPAANGRRTHG
jgi:serine/threonine protein phosphatase PrpC